MSIESVAYYLSTGSGLLLLILSVLVCLAYYQKSYANKAVKTLSIAIILGFLFVALNTLYWQVLGQYVLSRDIVSVETFRIMGSFLDLIFKGGSALAAYLHLKSLYYGLGEGEKKHWTPLTMPFYPNKLNTLKIFSLTQGNKHD